MKGTTIAAMVLAAAAASAATIIALKKAHDKKSCYECDCDDLYDYDENEDIAPPEEAEAAPECDDCCTAPICDDADQPAQVTISDDTAEESKETVSEAE